MEMANTPEDLDGAALERLRMENPEWRIWRTHGADGRPVGWVATRVPDDGVEPVIHADTAFLLAARLARPRPRFGRSLVDCDPDFRRLLHRPCEPLRPDTPGTARTPDEPGTAERSDGPRGGPRHTVGADVSIEEAEEPMPDTGTVAFGDGIAVPAIGQGTWYMGEDPAAFDAEVRALRTGMDLGAVLIDTAEMYGGGGAERVVGAAVAGRRDDAVIVSKAYPHNAGLTSAKEACERSLERLGTDRIDLYLLHWRGGVPLEETVEAMRGLVTEGKIRRWGVSNLDADDMAELWDVPGGSECVTDQVLYHAASRGVEFDLLPWCRDHSVPVMAYCPLAQAGRLRGDLLGAPALASIAEDRGVAPAQVALAWVVRDGDVVAIPKAVREPHIRENFAALDIVLTDQERTAIDAEFPPPRTAEPLDIV